MALAPSLFFYSESAPYRSDLPALGLGRVNTNLALALLPHLVGIGIYPAPPAAPRVAVHELLRDRTRIVPRAVALPRRVARKLWAADKPVLTSLAARLIGDWARRARADALFATLGADYTNLERLARARARFGGPALAYVVDDFACAAPQLWPQATPARIDRVVQQVLSSLDLVFAISEGMQAHLRHRYGVASEVLPLPYAPQPSPDGAPLDRIIYVGSINHLYAPGLRRLIAAVGQLRARHHSGLHILLTCDRAPAEQALGPLPAYVTTRLLPGPELAQGIARSLCAFLPYAFDEASRTMVETSFPSKLMEYLAHARCILVMAPSSSSAARYFRRDNLPMVIDEPGELDAALEALVRQRPNHAGRYRAVLEREHAPAIVAGRVLAAVRRVVACGR